MSKPYSTENLQEFADGDDEFVHMMLNLFVARTRESIVELKNALAGSDSAKARVLIHKMKPGIQSVAVGDASHRIVQVEKALANDELNPEILEQIGLLFSELDACFKAIQTDFPPTL